MELCNICHKMRRCSSMDPLGQLARGSLCQACRRERFAVYAGLDDAGTCSSIEKVQENVSASVGEKQAIPATSVVAAGETIDVNILTLGGDMCSLSISLDSSVADLKRLIQATLSIEYASQQLICGLEVLRPNLRVLKSFAGWSKEAPTPNISVIKVGYATRSERIVMEDAQSSEVNGTYTRMNTNCYSKDNDRSIRIFRYEADASWPAAWYIERLSDRGGPRGIYYVVPDQTLGETDDDARELGFPLPLCGWAPWSGSYSDPGQLPAPEAKDFY